MKKRDEKTLEALKKAKQAVDLANNALTSAIQELDDDELDTTGSILNTPTRRGAWLVT